MAKSTTPTRLACPHCGRAYDPSDNRWKPGTRPAEQVPYHDEHPPLRAVCPGSKKPPVLARGNEGEL